MHCIINTEARNGRLNVKVTQGHPNGCVCVVFNGDSMYSTGRTCTGCGLKK